MSKGRKSAKAAEKVRDANAKARAKAKTRALQREARQVARIEAALTRFKVGAAARKMAKLDARTFFERLDNYPRLLRSRSTELRGKRDAFVAVYELIVGLGDRVDSDEFISVAKQQARDYPRADLDPAAVILRRGLHYERFWEDLPEEEQKQARANALKLFNQDLSAIRWLLSIQCPVDEVRRRVGLRGDGIKRWEKAWRQRHGNNQPGAEPAARAQASTAFQPRMRPVEPDLDWLLEQVFKALDNRLPLDFPVDLSKGFIVYVQADVDETGSPRIVGARRLGTASRFSGKSGAKRFRAELKSVKRPTGSARRL